jgi:hypothetical protein
MIDPKIEETIIEFFGSDFSIPQGVINRFELFATLNNNAVIDNRIFDLIFKDEIHYKTKGNKNIEP